MAKYVIGIDPGKNGGIAVMRGGRLVVCTKMPQTPADIYGFLASYSGYEAKVWLERVCGRSGQSASASFRFGQNYGNVEMAVTAAGIPFETVTPQKWQKNYQFGTASQCASKTEWKNKLKACAQGLFPGVRITLATADAVLIANYGTLKEK